MSAELLREAASLIRHDVDFGQAHGDETFLLAVAEWFEVTAAEAVEDAADPRISAFFQFGDVAPERAAVDVANAYLGRRS